MSGGGQAGGRKASGMMTRRGFGAAVLAGVAVLGLSGCGKQGGLSYNYKLTVDVETPDGIRRSSSVIASLGSRRIPGFGGLGGSGPRAKGEAVAVDLPNGQTLFALLRGENDADWAGSIHLRQAALNWDDYETPDEYYDALRSDRTVYAIKRWGKMEGTNRPPYGDYPMLVTFKDVADPTSVEKVDPDDLAATFGAGYRLKAITVQVTDEPVTTGIEKRLGWLEDSKVMNNPGWARLPIESRKAINGLFSNTIGRKK
jgi:hypothetical protein